jgi:hypothetical protein
VTTGAVPVFDVELCIVIIPGDFGVCVRGGGGKQQPPPLKASRKRRVKRGTCVRQASGPYQAPAHLDVKSGYEAKLKQN